MSSWRTFSDLWDLEDNDMESKMINILSESVYKQDTKTLDSWLGILKDPREMEMVYHSLFTNKTLKQKQNKTLDSEWLFLRDPPELEMVYQSLFTNKMPKQSKTK